MNKVLLITFIFLFGNIQSGQSQSKSTYELHIEKHRDSYKLAFLNDERAPLKAADLPYLDFYKIDEKYSLSCSYEILEQKETLNIPTYSGNNKLFQRYVRFDCPIEEDSIILYGYRNVKTIKIPGYKDRVFVPFKDYTNGETSYGGGRYLDIHMISDNNNGLINVDMNKSYNPWCCYSAGYNCPIPPAENQIAFPIPVGEKNYKGAYKMESK